MDIESKLYALRCEYSRKLNTIRPDGVENMELLKWYRSELDKLQVPKLQKLWNININDESTLPYLDIRTGTNGHKGRYNRAIINRNFKYKNLVKYDRMDIAL